MKNLHAISNTKKEYDILCVCNHRAANHKPLGLPEGGKTLRQRGKCICIKTTQNGTKWCNCKQFTRKENKEMQVEMNEIEVNGVKYVKKDSIPNLQPKPNGKRAVIVVDRGWIYAGDVTEENGRIKLTRAVWVFRWTGGQGFDGLLDNPKKNAEVRVMKNDVDIPSDAEIFRIPVENNWGL